MIRAAYAFSAVVLAGFPAAGRGPGLSPAWSVAEPPSARWLGVHALPAGEGWLVCGRDTVWRVDGPGSVNPLVRSLADGGVLRAPLNLAVGPKTLLVYDRETANFIEADRATGRPVRSLVFTKAGGVPYTGSAWNGFRWVLGGYMKDATGAPLEIQARDATTFAFVGGTPLTTEERSLTGMLLPTGSVSGGPGGMTLLSFHALGRAIVVDEKGAELLSLALPIPPDRALQPGSVKAPPTSESEHRALHRGRTVPAGTGWMGSDPCVLLADLGRGDDALRWCRFSIRTGALVSETVLGLGSRDPGDWFSAAASTSGGHTTVAVLSWPYSAGGKRTASLHTFRVPGSSSRKQER
jgi:hypothetical protein